MNIHSITLEVAGADDVTAAERFYRDAFGLDGRVGVRRAEAPTSGFRGFAPSLILAQPADVDALFARALEAGAETLKPVAKSLWGYGGSLRAPEGTVWQIASANKTSTGPATGAIEKLVLLLGVDDVKASKAFYSGQGVTVSKSYGSKYVEFDSGPITLALYKRENLAKQVGVVDATGTGSHRIAVNADGSFSDPDGFAWEAGVVTR
ncbi:glyoxalase [Agromyces laixinhei]|uniref:glyoxalase n=1 Tax=Agromyces laixinhei TaxID=2585717 RepID=UPI0012EDC024|nr:glyoxalase [Agromyces laixinhei]